MFGSLFFSIIEYYHALLIRAGFNHNASILYIGDHKCCHWASYSQWLPCRRFHDTILLSQVCERLWYLAAKTGFLAFATSLVTNSSSIQVNQNLGCWKFVRCPDARCKSSWSWVHSRNLTKTNCIRNHYMLWCLKRKLCWNDNRFCYIISTWEITPGMM